MPTTSEASISRWTRFIPRQFSLRGLLVLITFVAVITWWAMTLNGDGVSKRDVDRLKPGMSVKEVTALLGQPSFVMGGKGVFSFIYRVQVQPWRRQGLIANVHFKSNQVSSWTYHEEDK